MMAPVGTAELPASTARSLLRDLPIIVGGMALFYGLISLSHYWTAPVNAQANIQLDPSVLPKYALFSVARILTAYLISLVFAIAYGQFAAHNARAERILIPLLDTLQSIPVLSFLPPVMVAMVALFPTRQFGVELGSILLIFTGQVWNMAFSVYSSTKNIPHELQEAAGVYRLSWWQRFSQLELPSAAIGLVWNSMMSVAGGWFFLMACEMFQLGSRDFRLPGLGSYLQTAASSGDTHAIRWGVATMIVVIVLLDQLVWRPVIAWGEKFKVEQVESADVPRSWVLTMLQHSRSVAFLSSKTVKPFRESLTSYFARQPSTQRTIGSHAPGKHWAVRLIGIVAIIAITYAVIRVVILLGGVTSAEAGQLGLGLAATFLRVNATLLIGAAWTIPVGVWIGFNPRLARIAQPLAQIAASVPATALFPIVLLLLIRAGDGLGIGSVILILLGTQWYILFNVIAGAIAIPSDLKEACSVFGIKGAKLWRKLILPGIFPYLVTGLVTASGGAWNASVIAEYFHFRDQTFFTTGLGAIISRASEDSNFKLLLAATILMAATVVTVNRLVWRRLYRLSESRYRLET